MQSVRVNAYVSARMLSMKVGIVRPCERGKKLISTPYFSEG